MTGRTQAEGRACETEVSRELLSMASEQRAAASGGPPLDLAGLADELDRAGHDIIENKAALLRLCAGRLMGVSDALKAVTGSSYGDLYSVALGLHAVASALRAMDRAGRLRERPAA